MTSRWTAESLKGLLCLLLVGASPSTGSAQERGYLVLAGIENGPASVFVQGRDRGTLRAGELTIELVPGVYRVEVVAQDEGRFETSVAIRSGDVSFSPVLLTPATAQLRLVHLDPARVPIRVAGQVIALTPATITVPAGENVVGVGQRTFCFNLAENASAYARVRNGRLDEVSGGADCTTTMAGETFEAPHLPLAERDFTRRSLWTRQGVMDPADERWPLLSASFSHDGRLVLASLRGGQVVVWDNLTGEEVRRFETLDDVWSAALSPNGDHVLARFYSSADQPALLDAHTGAVDQRFKTADHVGSVAMSFGGDVFVVGSPFGYVALLDAESGAELTRFQTRDGNSQSGVQLFRQTAVGVSPDGSRVFAVVEESAEVIVWDVASGGEVLRFSTNTDIADAAFSPDGQFLLTATTANRRSGQSGEVVVWDAETGAEIQHFRTSEDATMVALSPDGRFLLSSGFNELVVWTLFSRL